MLLLLSIAMALVWGLVRGGQFAQFKTLNLQSVWLVLSAFMAQLVLIYTPVVREASNELRLLVLAGSYLLLALFVWRNHRLPGMWLVAAGLGANALVILANGGYMPVTYAALVEAGKAHLVSTSTPGALVFGSKDMLLPLAGTRFWFLSDILVVPPPFPLSGVMSVGDVLLAVGMFWLITRTLDEPAPMTSLD
jgi:hypothetical protein